MFKVPFSSSNVTLVSYFNASNTSKYRIYGQSGVITGLQIKHNDETLIHFLDWISRKHKRESYSAYGAEIQGCKSADDREHYIEMALKGILKNVYNSDKIFVDFKALFKTISAFRD